MVKCLSTLLCFLASTASALRADPFPDPAPPSFVELSAQDAPVPQPFDRLTFASPPKPLNPNAMTSDWRRLLGPNHDATSPETNLLHDFTKEGPAKVWEVKKGEAYTSPAI